MLNNKEKKIDFANQEMILSGAGALFWPSQHLLIVADLHLEKGSYFAKRGNPLPLYDTIDTLHRLEQLIRIYTPTRILSLGDNIHDADALLRMTNENHQLLHKMMTSVNQWIWLMGNHDKQIMPSSVRNIYFCTQLDIENITFTHDVLSNKPFQILGHYHPKATFKNIHGKCFLVNPHKMILPSFGSYTGGLNIDSADFKHLMKHETFQVYLLIKQKIWRIR